MSLHTGVGGAKTTSVLAARLVKGLLAHIAWLVNVVLCVNTSPATEVTMSCPIAYEKLSL